MATPPTKQQVHRLLQMREAGLVSWKHLQPWAAKQIAALETPPAWLCELLSLTFAGDIDRCLREVLIAPPFEPFDQAMLSDYSVSCLMVRYERRELAWRTVLQQSGELVDNMNCGAESCEFYFELLNELEDSECDPAVEERQVRAVRQLLPASIALVIAEFEPFARAFREGVATRRSP